jgi:flagellar protein FlaG
MALDVSSIQQTSPIKADGTKHAPAPIEPAVAAQEAAARAAVEIPADLKTAIRDLQRVSEAFNRRLSFSLNEKLGQVVVKVIDNDTDKVVREIPPTELQHVYERIREVIGLLFDKSA